VSIEGRKEGGREGGREREKRKGRNMAIRSLEVKARYRNVRT